MSFRFTGKLVVGENKDNLLSQMLGAVAIIALVKLVYPTAIPFALFEVWMYKAPLLDALVLSWPIFLFALLAKIALFDTEKNSRGYGLREFKAGVPANVTQALTECIVHSVREEVAYRWLFFYSTMATLQLLNFLLFGFAGFGIIEALYQSVIIPFSNGLTLFELQPQLYSPFGWFVGAAIVTVNGTWRDGNPYTRLIQKLLGWCGGMFMFYLVFNYGMAAAILVHFVYLLITHGTGYILIALHERDEYKKAYEDRQAQRETPVRPMPHFAEEMRTMGQDDAEPRRYVAQSSRNRNQD